jgi:hypothetical protein
MYLFLVPLASLVFISLERDTDIERTPLGSSARRVLHDRFAPPGLTLNVDDLFLVPP